MKFRVHFSENREPIPYDYPHRLCGIFHHWLGPNELHEILSLYSLGWLKGKCIADRGLNFPEGATWDIGIYNDEIAERLVKGLLLKELNFYGMQIRKVSRLDFPDVPETGHRFLAGSPIMLRKVEDDGSRTHVTWDMPESESILNRLIQKKASEADFEQGKQVRLSFDKSFRNAKTKLVTIKGIKNKASVCPVIAEGTKEALEFLWTVGAGEMTGVGFGSLNHTGKL